MTEFRFIKEESNKWFVDLPEYLENNGSKADLQMVEGADTMLDIISGGRDLVKLFIEQEKFEGADLLILTERCDPSIGGGNYFLKSFEGKEINLPMWLCAVTEYVFGELPEQIFIKRVS